MPTARTLITDALIEVGVVGESQVPGATDAARALRILNRDIMDAWNVERQFAATRTITRGTFAANVATRLIGPSGTGSFILAVRPIEILNASFIYTSSTPNIARPIRLRDAQWYAGLPMPTFAAPVITDMYYSPAVPNGTLNAYPVPNAIVTVEVLTLSFLSQFTDLDTPNADFAPGFETAVCETLKELVSRAWHRPIPLELAIAARNARAVIQIQNVARKKPMATDAPSTPMGPVGSDSIGFRTRQF